MIQQKTAHKKESKHNHNRIGKETIAKQTKCKLNKETKQQQKRPVPVNAKRKKRPTETTGITTRTKGDAAKKITSRTHLKDTLRNGWKQKIKTGAKQQAPEAKRDNKRRKQQQSQPLGRNGKTARNENWTLRTKPNTTTRTRRRRRRRRRRRKNGRRRRERRKRRHWTLHTKPETTTATKRRREKRRRG